VALTRGEDHLTLRLAASALFEPDSSALTPDALKQPTLEALLRLLKRRRALTAQISIFTDNIGGATANQSFSAARAKVLYSALSSAGVPAARLTQRGAGASEAIASNETPEGRLENRRLEITIALIRLAPIRLEPATGP
jgi:OOP family OmpA-OmpF porin